MILRPLAPWKGGSSWAEVHKRPTDTDNTGATDIFRGTLDISPGTCHHTRMETTRTFAPDPNLTQIAEAIIARGFKPALAYSVVWDRATFGYTETFNRLVDQGHFASAVRNALNAYDRIAAMS